MDNLPPIKENDDDPSTVDSTFSVDRSSQKEEKKEYLSPMGSIFHIEEKNKISFSHAQMRRLIYKKKKKQTWIRHKRKAKAKHETTRKLAVNGMKQFSVPHGIDVRLKFLRVTYRPTQSAGQDTCLLNGKAVV